MKHYTTEGIIIRRVDFGEADRIITFLTLDRGKVGAMARGVRKQKSKLAGGIELFSVSQLTLIEGKGGLDQLISSRLIDHYRTILNDYDRLQFAYQAIDYVNKFTEDDAGPEYYEILHTVLASLSGSTNLAVVKAWFNLHLLTVLGHLPNLLSDSSGKDLDPETMYSFDIGEGSFTPSVSGDFGANEIKAWRILAQAPIEQALRIGGISEAAEKSEIVLDRFVQHNL